MIPPVEDALVRVRALRKVGPETERAVVDALVSVLCPCTTRSPALVRLVVDALVMVAFPVIVRADTEVVASVVAPKATRLVVVALVAVKLVNTDVTAFKSVEKKLVEVPATDCRLLVTRLLETVRLVAEAFERVV